MFGDLAGLGRMGMGMNEQPSEAVNKPDTS